jgi:hypothetical protein
MAKGIVINGVNYQSFDEVPPDVRERFQEMLSKFADEDLNGIPDIFEDDELNTFVFSSDSQIIINDNEYTSVEQLPLFVRQAFAKVMQLADQDGDGLPDVGSVRTVVQTGDDHPSWETDLRPLVRSRPTKSVQEPVNTGSRFISVLIALALITGGILFLIIFFLR